MAEGDGKRDLLLEFLLERDAPCPQCGYNLRNLTSDTCPECGEKLQLRVNLVEPKQAAAICGLVGLSAGAGMNGLLLIYGVVAGLLRSPHGLGKFFLINAVGLAIVATVLVVWLRNWRWLRRRSPRQRWTLAGACWLLALIDVGAFGILIN